jgi:ribosomal protein S18 acetylase RimI-like enzyme
MGKPIKGLTLSPEEVTDSHRGEMFANIVARDGRGRGVGYVEYSIFQGAPHLEFIEVAKRARRKGVARQLIQKLAGEYGYDKIDWGMSLPEGSELKKALDKEHAELERIDE